MRHGLRRTIARLATAAVGAATLAVTATAPLGARPAPAAFRGAPATRAAAAESKRVIYYYQTQYYNSQYQSLSPIWTRPDPKTGRPDVTDVMVAAFHLGYNGDGSPYIHLNDNVPSDPMFDVMWPEVATLQTYGITVRMMLGGAAQGSYADLFAHWKKFYPILTKTLRTYALNGIDLDVEETVSPADIETLIARLHADFGKRFVITLSPVASALWGGANLSGFSYIDLYQSNVGPDIAWFNGQFYSGFGNLGSKTDYDHVISGGVFGADKVVGGVIDNPNDGSGFVQVLAVDRTVRQLTVEHPDFGGVAGWEYFNALPGNQADPVEFARLMAGAMRLTPCTVCN